jgi:hypothetical protein
MHLATILQSKALRDGALHPFRHAATPGSSSPHKGVFNPDQCRAAGGRGSIHVRRVHGKNFAAYSTCNSTGNTCNR